MGFQTKNPSALGSLKLLSFTFLRRSGLSSFVHSKSHFVGEVPYHS